MTQNTLTHSHSDKAWGKGESCSAALQGVEAIQQVQLDLAGDTLSWLLGLQLKPSLERLAIDQARERQLNLADELVGGGHVLVVDRQEERRQRTLHVAIAVPKVW
mgnify:CR=1 FL=1